ncbi:MAG: hypothetical protein AAF568_03190 [Pseudomonadota bacterium]
MRFPALVLAVALAASGCERLNPTSAFHINPVAAPYNADTDNPAVPYDEVLTRPPFRLDKDCLPGLGGSVQDGTLVCQETAVEAIMLLASNRVQAGDQSVFDQLDKTVTAPDFDAGFRSLLGRNRLQDHLVYLSNDVCDINKAAMFGKITTSNILFDLSTIGLAAASTIVTGVNASRILSGAATATAGSRASLNENLIQNQLVTTLTRTIDNDRLEFLKSLASLRSQDLDSYTVEAAIADAILYHQKCSIYSALATLSVSAEDIKTSRQEHLARAQQFIEFAAGQQDDDIKAAAIENAKIEVQQAGQTQGLQ